VTLRPTVRRHARGRALAVPGEAHLLTTASLRAAAALYPDGDWDVRRFRPLGLVEADGDGFVEDGWIGRQVHLGAVTVTPFMPTVRCSLPTRAQPGLRRDVDIARTLNRHHGLNLGVYGNITEPGVIAVGDPVTVG
jgi:MOSC domain-containing protein